MSIPLPTANSSIRLLVLAFALGVFNGPTPSNAQTTKDFELTPELLASLTPEMRREIAGLHYLLNPYQLRQLFSLPSDADQRAWIEKWWRLKDPTPTTPVNEMRIEHNNRMQTAVLHFGCDRWPGWDHRGETLIRYGPPAFRRKLDWIVTPKGEVPPGESWHYTHPEMTVIFEDVNHTGRYTFAMNSLGNPNPNRIRKVWKPIDADFDPPRAGMPLPPTNWWYVYLSEEAQEKLNNHLAVREKYASTYSFNFNQNQLPFVFEIDQFKGGESVNRVEVNVELPVGPDPASDSIGPQKFTMTAVVLDVDYNVIYRERRNVIIPKGSSTESKFLWYPGQLVFTLPPQYCRMAVRVEGEDGRSSSYRSTVSINSFYPDMAISDIVFCARIRPTETNSPFNRGRLEVTPHPRREYVVSEKVPIYFELYNLELDEGGLASFLVEYWVVPKTPRKWGLWYLRDDRDTYASSRFESSAYGSDVPMNISIDSDNLWKGKFEFHVKVTDNRTLYVTERTATFQLID